MHYRILTPFFTVITLPFVHTALADPQQEQVLVTASRLPEIALTLPLSYASVDENALLITAPVHPNEIMQRIPGTWISRGTGQESLTALRSPVLTGAGGCGSVVMAADGISLRAPGFCNVNQLFDANIEQAESIEVIKGPATAMYGTNAMHGIINVLSPAPTDMLGQYFAIESGPNDYYRGKYAFGGSYGRHAIGLRLNGTTDGGYQDNSGYDQQKMSLRHDYNGDQWTLVSLVEGLNLNQETAGYVEGYRAYEDSDLRKTNANPEAYRDVWSMRAYSSATTELNNGMLLQLTPYYRKNAMEFLQHYVPWKALEKNGHESIGLRSLLHAQNGNLQWSTGIDAEYTQGWLKETQAKPFSPNQPAGTHYDYEVDATTLAAFVQLKWQLSQRWSLNSGLRIENTRYDYNNQTMDGDACSPEASACRFYRPADRKDDFDDWSLNVGASYQFSKDNIGYIRVANGFRAPEATELYRLQAGQTVADLDSERLDNLEVGLRGKLNTLQYDVSLYYMEKEDVIFQDSERQNVSGASTRHRGLELSLNYPFAQQWYAEADLTLARHTYSNNPHLLGISENIKGNDVDTAPRSFGSARIGWHNAASQAELEWVYMDNYYLEATNSYSYAGHNIFNLRISSELDHGFAAGLRITNLLNDDYAERADIGFGQYRYFVGQPRSAFLELSYRTGN
ncbi:MAG: TonB-dependent receptor [Parahaliea sp.]